MIETTRRIDGMTCEHCQSAVTEAIGELDGVNSVVVDVAAGSALISHDAPLDETLLVTAVDEAGYTLLP